MEITNRQMQVAEERGRELKARVPQATSASYHPESGLIGVLLTNGSTIELAAAQIQGLEAAKAKDLSIIHVSPNGFGLHFPKLDVDLYLPPLLGPGNEPSDAGAIGSFGKPDGAGS